MENRVLSYWKKYYLSNRLSKLKTLTNKIQSNPSYHNRLSNILVEIEKIEYILKSSKDSRKNNLKLMKL